MKIGVISDTHDRLDAIRSALDQFRTAGAELLIHCGDVESPSTVKLFEGWPVHFVLGNCDWNVDGMRYAVAEIGATLHERFGDLTLAGRRIAWTHGHDARLFHDLQNAGEYDFLFYGHSHVEKEHRAGRTRVINPGALHRVATKTCLLLDLAEDAMSRLMV